MFIAPEINFKSKSNSTQNKMVKSNCKINVDEITRMIIEFGIQYELIGKPSLLNKRNTFNFGFGCSVSHFECVYFGICSKPAL